MQEFYVTPSGLKIWLQRQDAPVLIDVRKPATFAAAPEVIPGATWANPFAVGTWGPTLPADRDIVVYCAQGHEIARGVRDLLTAMGYRAWYLAGGIDAWMRQSGGPKAPITSQPAIHHRLAS